LPQPLERVVMWGSTLARGLAYLHQRGVVFDAITRDQIVVNGGAAHWVCFDQVGGVAQDDPGAVPQRFQENRDGLSRLLLKMATGSEDAASAAKLPEPAAEAFSRAVCSEYPRAGDFADALEAVWRTLSRRQSVAYAVGACTDVGRVRNLNEDSMLLMNLADEVDGPSVGAFAVADGVGGHSAGDVASRLTVEALAEFRDRLIQEAADGQLDAEGWIGDAASAANAAVHREREVAASDMGSTLVMALLTGRMAKVLNVGDSRAYHLRAQGLRQVTTDHSLVQRLIDIGQLTPEEARRHPQKSVIYRVVGDQPDLAYDLFEVTLQPGEALLLCSDGLTDMVQDADMWRVWRRAPSPQAACEELVDRANEAGGYDNITVVIVQV
ncbi:MAG: Stp1/IreP family PP2C-type Ser/Thr phosphatase, partial [Paracoccaceae bacterium]